MTPKQGLQIAPRPVQVDAYSLSIALFSPLAAPAVEWQIYSVHECACNLRSADRRALALVAPSLGNGPFHIVVPAQVIRGFEPGMQAHITPEFVALPNGLVDLRQARRWRPRLTIPPAPTLHDAPQWLHKNNDRSALASPLLPQKNAPRSPLQYSAQTGMKLLKLGLQRGGLAEIAAGVQRLAGLGPGLTPSGDDFLIGWLFGLACLPALLARCGLDFAALAAAVAGTALPRTTWLSGVWIQHAAHGEFAEPWHALATAMTTGQWATEQALRRVRNIGAASGEDAVAGLWHSWESLGLLPALTTTADE